MDVNGRSAHFRRAGVQVAKIQENFMTARHKLC
jgi:hypothetical protein